MDFPFIFALRAELEARAGGNPSWNTGVNYARDLAKSADLPEVLALYHAAGLSLRRDGEQRQEENQDAGQSNHDASPAGLGRQ